MISVATPWAGLRRVLPPYLSLVAAEWPVDGYVLVVKERDALRSEASNAIDRAPRAPSMRARKKVSLPRHARPFIVVHRCSLKLYYKRVEAPALRILTALADGQTLEQAVAAAGSRVKASKCGRGSRTRAGLGWFCRRSCRQWRCQMAGWRVRMDETYFERFAGAGA
jgi:hypothetical protein